MLGQWAVWHGEEAKVCLDIMQRTGAHIELSLAKDQVLSIMVTSKLDSVMKARKDMVARLQTQGLRKRQVDMVEDVTDQGVHTFARNLH
ncbi:hypothetical protein NHX12_008121 [Muraenolepis orangiensis]|uniref:Vigilin N-terminal KH domain-containing protein n=1 Tax=Muraenolepis orangiensis TaxID=630683 RepID=A0A9Q0DKW5_9TELE|nr:hypothetical protein NHX12_008121 [Muraenolepis orangiensis]